MISDSEKNILGTAGSMTSRERILNAINHRPVDRVPIDLGGTRQTGISAFAYARLKRRLGLALDRPVRVFDLYQMLAEIDAETADRFGADCLALRRPVVALGIRNENWKPCALLDGTDVEVPGGFNPVPNEKGDWMLARDGVEIARMPRNGFYFDRFEKNPGALHIDLDGWTPPLLTDEDLENYRAQAETLHRHTEKALIVHLGPPYELFYGLGQGGFEDWIVTFATEFGYVRDLYEKLVDAWIENLKRLREAVGERIHILQVNDDFGTQHAPFLSTSMFRERLLPAYQRGFDWIHRNTGWKTFLHSDGALVPLLPSIIEMGVDILNPVQTTAAGMVPVFLKEKFGKDLVFWGGSCDCQGTLTRGTPEDVRREVRAHIAALRSLEGGHVFASVHNIQANVPPENIVALFDAALSGK